MFRTSGERHGTDPASTTTPAGDGPDDDVFPLPKGITESGIGRRSGYTGYTDYSSPTHQAIRSSPLRQSTTILYNSTGGLQFGQEGFHSPKPAALSSPIRSVHSGVETAGSVQGPIISRFTPFSRKPLSSIGPARVPFGQRESHLNPFLRKDADAAKKRRDMFVRKMRRDRDGNRAWEREEKLLELDVLSDRHREQAERSREALAHVIPTSYANLFEREKEEYHTTAVPRRLLPVSLSVSFGPEKEQELLRQLEQQEEEEMADFISRAGLEQPVLADTADGMDDIEMCIDDDDFLLPDLDEVMETS